MITRMIGRNRLFAVALGVAALLRLDAELGYRWQSWFNDSWDYVDSAVTLNLNPTRTSGYSLYLWLLKPFHSFALVTVSQHLMGLAVGVMIYGLAKRRFGAPSWLAVAMTLPVLFDGFEIQLEHLILSDTLYLFLTMLAVTVLLWWPLRAGPAPWWRSLWLRCAVAGALLSVAALVRTTGVPVLPLFGVYLLLVLALNRVGWRRLIASAVAFGITGLAPIVGYAGWFDLQHGSFNTSESAGVFLYSRVMTFAECSKMQLTPDLLSLCSTVPPDKRPLAQDYIWYPTSPLARFPAPEFSPLPNSLAEQFAIKAIEAQPLDYARVVFDDTWRAFDWPRTVFPNADTYDEYLFGYASVPVAGGHGADGYPSSAQAYLAGGNPTTRVVNPFAEAIRIYQRYSWLPGTVYGLILLAGLVGLVWALFARRGSGPGETTGSRETGGPREAGLAALLPWATSFVLIITPAATAEFDYRYVTTAVPFACLTLGMVYASLAAGPRRLRAGRTVSSTGGALAETSGAARLTGGITSGSLGGGTADAGHDERDFAPDAS
jgi:hypothetical protein